MGCVATMTSGADVDVAVGAGVGKGGGLGDSAGARVGAIVGAAVGGAGESAATGPEHPARPGNKRSAATAARLIRVICTRIILASPSGRNTKMITKLPLRASAWLALAVFALCACGAPNPPGASSPPAAPTAAAAATAVSSPTQSAPGPTIAPTKPIKPTDEAIEDFSPTKQSVWDTQVGPDSMKGCSGGSILPAYGLVQITPEGNRLVWKNQEPKPYPMTRVKPGVFAYEGPTALNDGTVKMVATFSAPTTVKMTRSFTPKAEASCVHTHEYTGVFKWETAPAATPKP
jgi:hypothetical protein